jgi:hypothetical protein
LQQQVRALQERLTQQHSELGENQNSVLASLDMHRLFCQQAAERMKKAENAGHNNSNSSLTGQVRQSGWAEASGAGGETIGVSGGRKSSQRQKRSRGGWSGMGNFGGGGFQH